MNPAIIGAAVTTARKLAVKKCPKCGKALERMKLRDGIWWSHMYELSAFWLGGNICDYSEPERKGKR